MWTEAEVAAGTKKGGAKGKKRSTESDKGDKKYHCAVGDEHWTEKCFNP